MLVRGGRAVAFDGRCIGVILHRMWIDGTTYRWAEAKPIAAQALIKEEYETQAGRTEPLLPEVPSPERWSW